MLFPIILLLAVQSISQQKITIYTRCVFTLFSSVPLTNNQDVVSNDIQLLPSTSMTIQYLVSYYSYYINYALSTESLRRPTNIKCKSKHKCQEKTYFFQI